MNDANPRTRAAVQQCLRNDGFAVLGDERLPGNVRVVSVTIEIRVALRQLEVLWELAWCDGTPQMATALSVTVDAVENQLGRLMKAFGVHSRTRLLGKSIELGLVPIGQASVPGVAADVHPHGCVALRVSDAHGRGRVEVEQCLRNDGFSVLGDRRLARNASAISAATELGVTLRQLEVLEALARCDGTDQMARTLSVTVATVEDHLQRLKEMLEVCSRARLLALAIGRGLLILEPRPCTWPRHACIRSSN